MRNWKLRAAVVLVAFAGTAAAVDGAAPIVSVSDYEASRNAQNEETYQPTAYSLPAAPGCQAAISCDGSCGGTCSACSSCGKRCNDGCGCNRFGDRLGAVIPCRRCPDAEAWHLFPQDNCRGIKVHGWVAQGATTNPFNTTNPAAGNGNLPVTFNYRNDEYQLNQAYGIVERETDGSCGLDFGGRVDLLYGEDYIFTQAAGLETRQNGSPHWNSATGNGIGGVGRLGLAMPQVYGEAAYGDFKLKVGHFYSILGYESVMAPSNFFYSHSYTKQYGEPFTHTGGLLSWDYSDRLTFVGGVVNGWDKFDAVSDRASLVGGVTFRPYDNRYWVAFNVITGDEDSANPGVPGVNQPVPYPNPTVFGNRTTYSLVFNWNVMDRLVYVFQHDLGIQQNGGAMPGQDAEWYGINQYLFYTINDCWKAGLRGEWFRDDDGFRVVDGFNPANREGNWYEVALGVNWTPHPNVTLRPEARYDWIQSPFAGGGRGGPFQANVFPGRVTQFTAGMDLILTF